MNRLSKEQRRKSSVLSRCRQYYQGLESVFVGGRLSALLPPPAEPLNTGWDTHLVTHHADAHAHIVEIVVLQCFACVLIAFRGIHSL